MAFQFIHIETYGRTAAKKKTGGHSIDSIVKEAERVEGNCPHIENPQRPRVVFGITPSEAGLIASQRADRALDAMGRRMRSDAPCLLAGVATYPDTVDECKSEAEKAADYKKWERSTIEFLQQEYGDCLKSVIRHVDEKHPHIHFYVVPELTENNKLDLEGIHIGRRLSAEAKRAGKVKGDQNKAYKEGMRQFQNKYYENVSIYFGHGRIGPGKRRLTRKEWRIEQANNLQIRESIERVQAKHIAEVEIIKKKQFQTITLR